MFRDEEVQKIWREFRRNEVLKPDVGLTVGQVAYYAGFRKVSSFSDAFKKMAGRSPGAYRKEVNMKKP